MSHDDLFKEVLEKAAAYKTDEPPVTEDADDPTVMVETTEGDENDKKPVEKQKTSSVSVVNLFRNPEAHPLVLDLALLRKYGPEWLGWELETLELRISQDFNTPTVSDLNIEKVQACKTLHLVDSFWQRWEVFVPCTAALNGVFADFEILHAPTVASCMIAVDIANRIREDVPWSDEIKYFLGVVHRFDDILCVQPPLDFVHIDVTGLPLDCDKIAKLWPEARSAGKPPADGTMETEQLRRMLEVREILEDSRKQLRDQLMVIQYV